MALTINHQTNDISATSGSVTIGGAAVSASEIRANTISNAAGTGPATLTGQYAAKAWVNFNGTGTVAIRQSGNVSSITDGGTGIYTVNFSSSFSAADYSAVTGDNEWGIGYADTLATGSVRTVRVNNSFSTLDTAYVYLTVDGDLA